MKHRTMITTMFALAVSGLGAAQSQSSQTGMDMQQTNKGARVTCHEAIGTVKSVDPAAGTVTLAHGPVKCLNWPAMTLGFTVKDKALFDKLSVGKKVDVEIVQQQGNYVITAVQ
jgi:Cu(I)/Ag(I) efflux system protein CusF